MPKTVLGKMEDELASLDEHRLAAIEARLSATTPGPWRHGSLWDDLEAEAGAPRRGTDVIAAEPDEREGRLLTHTFCVATPWQHVTLTDGEDGPHGPGREERLDWLCHSEADARFLAHARQDVADLLAAVRRLLGLRQGAGGR